MGAMDLVFGKSAAKHGEKPTLHPWDDCIFTYMNAIKNQPNVDKIPCMDDMEMKIPMKII